MTIHAIISRDNPQYKELRRLADNAQARRKVGQSLLNGLHLCDTWLCQIGTPLLCVVGESALSNPEVSKIVQRCEKGDTRVVALSDALFHPLSQVEHGVALLFLVKTPLPPATPSALTQSSVLLDRVQDPGNLGSILRSAAAAGIKQVFCSTGTVQAWSPKVLRAGMGAHFMLEIFENAELAPLVEGATIPVIATSSHTEQSLYQLDLSAPVSWLFGHEGQGVDKALLAAAKHRLAIPHVGDVESLNVAASAAVCFFEQVRQTLAR